MPLTVTVYSVPLPGQAETTAVVAPAVPLMVTSLPVNPATGSLKTTANSISVALVGFFWGAAWSMVTVGAVVS